MFETDVPGVMVIVKVEEALVSIVMLAKAVAK
jgi:hypothetical protein